MTIKSISKSELKFRKIIRQEIRKAIGGTNLNQEALLDDAQAAKFLNIATGTLPVWRTKGKGPKYLKISKCVRYRVADLEEYIQKNTVTPR